MSNGERIAYEIGYAAWSDRYITCFHEQERRRIAGAIGSPWEGMGRREKSRLAQAWADGNLRSYADALRKNMAAHILSESDQ